MSAVAAANIENLKLEERGFAVLKLWVEETEREKYAAHILKHNLAILNDAHPNSGFDLFVADDVVFSNNESKLVNHRVKGAMYIYKSSELIPAAFYLYPRSSIYKTPFVLANSVGVIDSGYRGFICSAIRYMSDMEYTLAKDTRITQICHPSLCPIFVDLVDNEADLGETTRGEGGFGSTGV
jgi:dUTP pyrophosphatase